MGTINSTNAVLKVWEEATVRSDFWVSFIEVERLDDSKFGVFTGSQEGGSSPKNELVGERQTVPANNRRG